MENLASCYFCGTAVEAPVEAHPVLPADLGGGDGPTVTLCPTCRRKYHEVLSTALSIRDADADAAAVRSSTTGGGSGDADGEEPGNAEDEEPGDADGGDRIGAGSDGGSGPGEAPGSPDPGGVESGAEAPGGTGTGADDPDDGLEDAAVFGDVSDRPEGPGRGESDAGGATGSGHGDEGPGHDGGAGGDPDGEGSGDTDDAGGEDAASDTGGGDAASDAGGEDPPSDADGGDAGESDDAIFSTSTPAGGGAGDLDPEESVGEAAVREDDPDEPDVDLGTPPHSKVVRQLQNRQFPVDREEIVTVATGAYGLSRTEAEEALDALVAKGILREEEGRLLGGEG